MVYIPYKLKTGSYVGDGVDNRSITGVGFAPDLVLVFPYDATQEINWRSSTFTGDNTAEFRASTFTADWIQALESDGFQIGSDNEINQIGDTYYYVAIQLGFDRFDVGTYTGDGNDNRNISSSIDPDMVWVSPNSASYPSSWKISENSGEDTMKFTNLADAASNELQSLGTGQFTIGSGAAVNSSTVEYQWAAFEKLSGYIATGTYAGNGVNNTLVNVGFRPDFIVVKQDGTQESVMYSNDTPQAYGIISRAPVSGAINSMDPSGFRVGTAAQTNTDGLTYRYFAIKALSGIKTIGPLAPADDTLAVYHLDDNAASTTVIDSTGNYNLTSQQNTNNMHVDGQVNGALSFNGSSDYASNSSFASVSGDCTISVWVRTTSSTTFMRAVDLAQAADVGIQIFTRPSGSNIVASVDDSGGPVNGITGTTLIDDGEWHHIAVVRTGTGYEMFVDGSSEGTDTGTAPTYSRLFVGARSTTSNYWNGDVDELVIYNRALSSEEITAIYNAGLKAMNSDAWIMEIQEETLNSIAYVKRPGEEGSAYSDAHIKKLDNDKTITGDSFVRRVESKLINSIAYKKKTYDVTISGDAFVKRLGYEGSINSNSFIKKLDNAEILNSDSFVKKINDETITSDAFIEKPGNDKALSSDALIKTTYDKTLNSDSSIKVLSNEETLSSDYYIKVLANEETISSDSYVKAAGNTETINSDAFIKRTYFQNINTYAYLKYPGYEGSINSDANIKKLDNPQTITSDSYILDTQAETISSDALVKTTQEKTIISDASVKQTYQTDIYSDAYIKVLDNDQAINSDSHIEEVQTETIASDAFIKRLGYEGSIISDVFIKKLGNDQTILSDAFIEKITSQTLNGDLVVSRAGIKYYITSDACIKKIDNTETLNSDAYVLKLSAGALQSYTYIKKLDNDQTLSGDSNIKIIDNTETIFSDGWIEYVATETLTSDAQIKVEGYEGSINSIYYVKKTYEESTIGYAYIKAASKTETITSDATLTRITTPWKIWPLVISEEYNLSDPDERIRFYVPEDIDGSPVHIHIQFASDAAFTNVIADFYSWMYPTRWRYWNGSQWDPWPAAGVPNTYAGNEGRFEVQGPDPETLLPRGVYYWRLRTVII